MSERRTNPQQVSVAKPPLGATTGAKPEDVAAGSENVAAEGASLEESAQQVEPGGNADRFKGEYEYVPLECPRCGLAGKVKISRLDRTFTCKQCKRVFHITVHGVVNGERPPPDVLPDPEAPLESQRVNRVERWFSRLPPWLRWSVAGGLVGGLMVLVMLFGKLLADPFPADLDARAVIAGQAFAKGDWRTLDRLAMSGTSEALRQWYDKTPREAFAALDAESNVEATVGTASEMFRRAEKDEKGKKKLVADFRTCRDSAPREGGGPRQVHGGFCLGPEQGRPMADRWTMDARFHRWQYVVCESRCRCAGESASAVETPRQLILVDSFAIRRL